MVKAKRFVLAKLFDGMPKESDFELKEEELPELQNEEFLVHAQYLSVDPYMRLYATKSYVGQTMIGMQVAKILESKNENYPVGKNILVHCGWTSHAIVKAEINSITKAKPMVLSDLPNNLSVSLHLGVLGLLGHSAYFGLLELCNPKAGEIVVVSGAAGATGSYAGQIAKIKGCHVIGIAGSDEKLKWCKSIGFDHVINYKTENVKQALEKAAPNGVDCYFDNVGGEMSSIIMQQMNVFGRVCVCGSISAYNHLQSGLPKASVVQLSILHKQLRVEGFLVHRWIDKWAEAVNQNLEWIQENKLIIREHVTDGFENIPKAFIGLMKGENIGKAIVKV